MANHFFCSWTIFPPFLTFLFLFSCVNSIHFKINKFGPVSTDVLYEGDARPSFGFLEFNDVLYTSLVGRVSYARDVPIWDPRTNRVTDFTTHFTFLIENRGSAVYAAGLAFFLAPAGFEIPSNSAGGYLGLFNTSTSSYSSRNQIVLVEFDTFSNPSWDPPVQHVGINTNSISSVKWYPWKFSLYNGRIADAWISYNSTTMNLTVKWSYRYNGTFSQRENFTLSHRNDLKAILPQSVKVGISAATSQHTELH